jgi:two-component system nitrogen regulation sensor histidine kinase NtrY
MKDGENNNSEKTKPRSFPFVLGAVVLLLLTFLIILQASNWWKGLAVDSADDTLLLYALSSLNFIAFVIFGFIFARNILKLTRERRALLLGSKIKTRLLVYFCAVSLLPLIAMAVFSYWFLNRAIDRWFTDIPENVVRQARDVETQAVKNQTGMLGETAGMLAAALEDPTAGKLEKLLEKGNLTRIEIIGQNGEPLMAAEKTLAPAHRAELEKILAFIRRGEFKAPALSDGEGFDAAAADFPDGKKLVIVPDLRNTENLGQLIDSSLVEFDKLKNSQDNVRLIGLTTLGLLTFLLIFASSWTAFYVAKGLTRPIKALAEGADEIARGNFGHRVDVDAEDELALLVASFNQMSAKLEENAAELSRRRKYIETVLQTLSTGVISFDSENRVTTINNAARNILRLETGEFSGFRLDHLVGEETRAVFEKLIGRARRIGQANEQTVLQKESRDGASGEKNETLPVALSATALPDKNGTVLVIEDLSELIAAQRASAWSEVARRMAHEIKNPLTPIQLSAERIAKRFAQGKREEAGRKEEEEIKGERERKEEEETKDQRPKTKDQRTSEQRTTNNEQSQTKAPISDAQLTRIVNESTATILREVQSLKSMVDEFSRFARLPNVALQPGDLNEVVKKTVLLYEDRAADVNIEMSLADGLPEALIDEEQLKRVFVNLIDNAIEVFDAAQEEKRIEIKTFYDRARDLIVAEVSDNGKGIPPADFPKLFQPYYSTKGRGTGLGLAIVQRIISEHRGKIKAVNNSPRGAKFIVELPVSN